MAAIRRYKHSRMSISSAEDCCTVNLSDVMDDITWTLTPESACGTYRKDKDLAVTVPKKLVLGRVTSRINRACLFWFVEDYLYPVYIVETGKVVVNTSSRFKTKEEAKRTCLRGLLKLEKKMPTNMKCSLMVERLIIRADPVVRFDEKDKLKKLLFFKFCTRSKGWWKNHDNPTVYVI